MLVLKPSSGIVKATKLDFNLINFILSQFLKVKWRTPIKVEKCRDNWSAYWPDDKIIRIDLKQGTSLKYIITTLLHEIRHVKQVKEIKGIRFNYSNYTEYYNSPEEKDARKFENLAVNVCKIYDSYKGIEEKYAKFNFDSFKELIDNNKR
jgi:hypothetical protein